MIGKLFAAALLAGVAFIVASADAALASRRVALVIGNSAYRNVAQLPNPGRDAAAMADLFREAGFDVVSLKQNVGNLDFKRALRRFEDTATGADVAVIYYAGHGIEINGTNYLVPIDAKLASDRDAYDEAIGLERMVRSAEPAEQLRLIILDACRDNPFTRTMKRRRKASSRSLNSGLVEVAPTRIATLIAYASKGGSTADDGDGEHSPFTTALLKNLTVPGLDLRLALGRVRDDVLKQTNHRQEPFVYGSLGGSNVALVPLPKTPRAPSVAEAKADYELVDRIGSRKAWEVFINTHKTGFYADLARAQIAKLDAKAAPKAIDKTRLAALTPPGSGAVERSQKDVEDKPAVATEEADVAALGHATAATPRTGVPAPATEAAPVKKPPANTRELVKEAQQQLARLGCFEGTVDGLLGPKTKRAVTRYLSRSKASKDEEVEITTDLIAALAKEKGRVCPFVCGSNQILKGGRCYTKRPSKPPVADRKGPRKKVVREQRERRPPALRPLQAPQGRFGGASAMIGVGF